MANDPIQRLHEEWIGYVQPVGLVVSGPALEGAQAVPRRGVGAEQDALLSLTVAGPTGHRRLTDFAAFAHAVLGWEPADLVAEAALPEPLSVPLREHGDVLRPTWAVPDPDRAGQWLLLVVEVPADTDLDRPPAEDAPGWAASPEARLERLCRDTGVPIGLLSNGRALRLVYAPKSETAGHATFDIHAMTEVAGRPILGALLMLLGQERLFVVRTAWRLPALLESSRKHQSTVSTALAEQVFRALDELVRGVQSADEASRGRLLMGLLAEHPEQIYGGLVTTLLRLVVLLYAEDRGLLPADPVWTEHYGVTSLFERLREDAGRWPDTMDQRYGAWARLLAVFRLVHDGGGHGDLRLPARQGRLFDPDAFPFLEGRTPGVLRVVGDVFEPPRISDGVVWRVLDKLLVLNGERLSYRTLDVEQIGSVYEALMGYELESAAGPSLALKPKHVVVDLAAILALSGEARLRALKDEAELKVAGAVSGAVKAAGTVDELAAALRTSVSPRQPRVLPPGTMYLQPGDERRRTGSHYTPRTLTEPIVRTTLRPVLEALGGDARPDEVLSLRVCDPAMGSGAFLVEACRQLAARLVQAWDRTGERPAISPDEEPELHAMRLVAERCLFGVDKNPFAVDLAKLSLWLVTFARDRAFTFLDHALKHGDSLVGLTRRQIARLDWKDDGAPDTPIEAFISTRVGRAVERRAGIGTLGDGHDGEKRERFREAEDAVEEARRYGDRVVAAFFEGSSDRERGEALRRAKVEIHAARLGDGEAPEAAVKRLRAGRLFRWTVARVEEDLQPGFAAAHGGGRQRQAYSSGRHRSRWSHPASPGGRMNAALESVKLTDIQLDGDTQMRAGINWEVVKEYAERMLAGDVFPPVDLYEGDGTPMWIGDGHHRCLAAREAGRDEVLANVHPGGKRDAKKQAFGANGKHGLPRTKADKRHTVQKAFEDDEYATWSDRQIAELCCVSHPFVATVRASLETASSRTRKGADGRVTNVGGITGANVARGLPTDPENGAVAKPGMTAHGEAIADELRAIGDLVARLHQELRERRERLLPFVPTSAWLLARAPPATQFAHRPDSEGRKRPSRSPRRPRRPP